MLGIEGTPYDVVCPTLHRPEEVNALLDSLEQQTYQPRKVIVVDGAEPLDSRTENIVANHSLRRVCEVVHVRSERGTSLQRNRGIEDATAPFVAFLDDDVRCSQNFFELVLSEFVRQPASVAAIGGYRGNLHAETAQSRRWEWYRRLGMLSGVEPGRFDHRCGIPVNTQLQGRFTGVRTVDFLSTACVVYRREVLDAGFRFDTRLAGYGVAEDVLFSMSIGRNFTLLQHGDALAEELHAPGARSSRFEIGRKVVENYYHLFDAIDGPLTPQQRRRFWTFQCVEVARVGLHGIAHRNSGDASDVAGRVNGAARVLLGRSPRKVAQDLVQ